MNRIDRVTAILIQLQSKRIVKAQDIAERFNISLRTVYRDIRTLEEAGIPLVGETGVGYSIMDGYRLPPVMFTIDEATAFLTAEKLVEKLTDASTDESYKSAMYKIKSVLRSTEKDYLETMDHHIEVLDNPYIPKERTAHNSLQPILKSIAEKKVLSIHYFANHSQENTSRNIEPVGIFYSGSNWHLLAFCQLRNDYRDFRIDRIQQITSTPLPFKKEHPSLKSFLKQIAQEKELNHIVILVNKEIMKHLGEQKYYNGFISQREVKDKIEMTFLTCSVEGFARWYMMFGDHAEVVSPLTLKQAIKKMATAIAKKL
ncbi:MAG: YafY family transcriptional regulator [Bacteroidetes bacterium]|nr:YafY family transcriptional regulator [Bacteroidota bacterium]